jgi:hypothetical protein
MNKWLLSTSLTLSLLTTFTSQAQVTKQSTNSFTIEQSFTVHKSISTVHHEFSHVGRWWTSEHSLSGKGSNMNFNHDCFCEQMPNGKNTTFMTFVDRQRNKSATLKGAIGPLRGEDVEGRMTWTFNKEHHGTKVTMRYLVSGKEVAKHQSWPTELDALLQAQMKSFKSSLSKR